MRLAPCLGICLLWAVGALAFDGHQVSTAVLQATVRLRSRSPASLAGSVEVRDLVDDTRLLGENHQPFALAPGAETTVAFAAGLSGPAAPGAVGDAIWVGTGLFQERPAEAERRPQPQQAARPPAPPLRSPARQPEALGTACRRRGPSAVPQTSRCGS
jgi:hypothetical protein